MSKNKRKMPISVILALMLIGIIALLVIDRFMNYEPEPQQMEQVE